MNKTEVLRTAIQAKLKTLASNVYYTIASDTTATPYVVYELSELTYNDGKTTYQMEMNIQDYGKDTSTVEDLTDDIQRALNKWFYMDGYIEFMCYKGSRQRVEEEDKQIIRRRLLFEIQLHEKEGE